MGQKFLDFLMTGVLGILVFIVWLAKSTDWMIKFWPFFCILIIPLLALSFLWHGFVYIGMTFYFIFCGIKARYDMTELTI